MKRIALAGLLLAAFCQAALAANATNTPIIPPTETGENSSMQQQVVDVARFKPGFCTVTAGGTGNQAVTCNGAAGSITLPAQSFGALSNTVITSTDSKLQTGDQVLCTLDSHAAATATNPECSAQNNGAGAIVFTISNSNATTATGSITLLINFLILTVGNPN
jgi:hypothetical protein